MNATISKLHLKYCDLDEEATVDFVDFVQNDCNQGRSALHELVIDASRRMEMFTGANSMANVAATMLIGSSLQVLHLSDNTEYVHWDQFDFWFEGHQYPMDWGLFITALLENEDQIRLESLTIDELTVAGANALIDYLPQACHLRHLTVLQMAHGVDLALLMAALRRNGSLRSVVVTTKPATWNAPEQAFFTLDELHKIQAYTMRNQCIPSLLQEGPQSLLTHLVATSRPVVRTAPTTVVAGLLSGGQTLGL